MESCVRSREAVSLFISYKVYRKSLSSQASFMYVTSPQSFVCNSEIQKALKKNNQVGILCLVLKSYHTKAYLNWHGAI